MASNAASTSARPAQGEAANQAGPLPRKLGEIGYRTDNDVDLERGIVEGEDSDESLPTRHPADREAPANTDVPLTPTPINSDEAVSTRPSLNKIGAKRYKALGGITLVTFSVFIAQLLVFGGTIAVWVFAIKLFNATSKQRDTTSYTSASGSVFIYVVFVILSLFEIVLLDRRLYRLRAERYSFLHPGEVLPTSNASMGIAPWHRPPLPTYAAALAQGVRGTGDVEDTAIAVPPPPAYGNTRDSRMLLQGYLRSSLRAQRPVSEHSQKSDDGNGERPLSYASQDPQWQEIQDAERMVQLERTLSKLQDAQTLNVAPGTSTIGPMPSSEPSD